MTNEMRLRVYKVVSYSLIFHSVFIKSPTGILGSSIKAKLFALSEKPSKDVLLISEKIYTEQISTIPATMTISVSLKASRCPWTVFFQQASRHATAKTLGCSKPTETHDDWELHLRVD